MKKMGRGNTAETRAEFGGRYRAAQVNGGEAEQGTGPVSGMGSEPWGRELARVLLSCRRTALVVVGLCEELRGRGQRSEELDAMVWASNRVAEWVAAAQRNAEGESLLSCLAEAACSNMALRGLAYEYAAVRSQRSRLGGLVLSQSRKVGSLLARASELSGRRRARTLGALR